MPMWSSICRCGRNKVDESTAVTVNVVENQSTSATSVKQSQKTFMLLTGFLFKSFLSENKL